MEFIKIENIGVIFAWVNLGLVVSGAVKYQRLWGLVGWSLFAIGGTVHILLGEGPLATIGKVVSEVGIITVTVMMIVYFRYNYKKYVNSKSS